MDLENAKYLGAILATQRTMVLDQLNQGNLPMARVLLACVGQLWKSAHIFIKSLTQDQQSLDYLIRFNEIRDRLLGVVREQVRECETALDTCNRNSRLDHLLRTRLHELRTLEEDCKKSLCK